jgi:hypothetical protein
MLNPILRTISLSFAPALILIAITTLGFLTDTAWAGKVVLSGTHSQTGILASCTKAGGQFNSNDSGFGCTTDKGSVQCTTKGQCTGECATCGKPAIAHKGDPILGVLSGTTLKAGTNTPAKTTATPIRVKTPVAHSGTDSTERQGKKK